MGFVGVVEFPVDDPQCIAPPIVATAIGAGDFQKFQVTGLCAVDQ